MSYQRYWLAALVLAGAASVQAAEPAVVFHVATIGCDKWSGTLAGPNSTTSDGPFATVEQAHDAVRELKRRSDGTLKRPVTVLIHGGTYPLSKPIRFTAEDSGTADYPVVYAAADHEQPVFSGARTITGLKSGGNPLSGWKLVNVDGKQLWAADIPEVREGKWYFHQLWIDGQRRQRARHPNQGFFRVVAARD